MTTTAAAQHAHSAVAAASLGLSVVRHTIVEAHGGAIDDAVSEVGGGSTFTLRFPYSDCSPSGSRPHRREELNVSERESILVVEDDPDMGHGPCVTTSSLRVTK